MKSKYSFQKLLFSLTLILILMVIIFTAFLLIKTKQSSADTIAREVLTRNYGATLLDYENLTTAITKSAGDDQIIYDYLYTIYGDQITEAGYVELMKNRIPILGALDAYEENSDLKISTIKLKQEDALEGSIRFSFSVEVYAKENTSSTFTYKGDITLIQEDNRWKVNDITPRYR